MIVLNLAILIKILYYSRISLKITVNTLVKKMLLCLNLEIDNVDNSYFKHLKSGKNNIAYIVKALNNSYFEALKKVKDNLCPLLDQNKYIYIICCIKKILINDSISDDILIGFHNHSITKKDIINNNSFSFEELLCNLLFYCIVQAKNKGNREYNKNINNNFLNSIVINKNITLSNNYLNYNDSLSSDEKNNLSKDIKLLLKKYNIDIKNSCIMFINI